MTTQSEELNERKKNWWPSEVIASFFPLPVVCLVVVGMETFLNPVFLSCFSGFMSYSLVRV